MRRTVFDRAMAYSEKSPGAKSGEGGHDQTFALASSLIWGFGLSGEEAIDVLREWNKKCVPPWSERELKHKAISAAASSPPHPPGWLLNGRRSGRCSAAMHGKEVKRPEVSESEIEKLGGVLFESMSPEWLIARSPFDPREVGTRDFLARMFPAGERAQIFTNQRTQGETWPGCEPPDRAAEGAWFLAAPVDGIKRINPRTLKPSFRSEENVTAWRWLVLESDKVEARKWLAVLANIRLPIETITTSGNRSLHALCRFEARTKAEWDSCRDRARPYLAVLGCDPAAMSAVRLTRLPGVLRADTGKRQTLVYFNPSPSPCKLLELPLIR